MGCPSTQAPATQQHLARKEVAVPFGDLSGMSMQGHGLDTGADGQTEARGAAWCRRKLGAVCGGPGR